MSKNYMEEVARMLGVELGEEFEIEGATIAPYKITEYGLINSLGEDRPQILLSLLKGSKEITKKEKPWMPKDGENVFYVNINDNGAVWEDTFTADDLYSVVDLALGWVFKTREEAEAHKEEIMRQKERILKGELRAELVEVQK